MRQYRILASSLERTGIELDLGQEPSWSLVPKGILCPVTAAVVIGAAGVFGVRSDSVDAIGSGHHLAVRYASAQQVCSAVIVGTSCPDEHRGGVLANENDGSPLDRELIELLNELRVALPGVQVLFAFLLTIAFSPRFETLSSGERATYFVAVLATAGATVFLIAPSAQHRLRWRQHDKERLLRSANRMTIAGLVLLAIAVSTSVFLVTKLLYDVPAAGVVAAVLAAMFLVFWYILPLSRQIRDHDASPGDASEGDR